VGVELPNLEGVISRADEQLIPVAIEGDESVMYYSSSQIPTQFYLQSHCCDVYQGDGCGFWWLEISARCATADPERQKKWA
jgi:hypothetical protein